MIRPSPTPTPSLRKYGTLDQPVIGESWVGVADGDNEKDETMAIERSSWNPSVVTSTVVAPWERSSGTASAMFS